MKKNVDIKHRLRMKKWLKGFSTILFSSSVALVAMKYFKGHTSHHNGKSKMLTQDGLLVEIDNRAMVKSKRKLAASEIYNWIKK